MKEHAHPLAGATGLRTYRVQVQKGEDGWLVAVGVNPHAPRGLFTQGRDFNELTLMVRDAIEALTDSSDFTIQLLVPASIKVARRRPTPKRCRSAA